MSKEVNEAYINVEPCMDINEPIKNDYISKLSFIQPKSTIDIQVIDKKDQEAKSEFKSKNPINNMIRGNSLIDEQVLNPNNINNLNVPQVKLTKEDLKVNICFPLDQEDKHIDFDTLKKLLNGDIEHSPYINEFFGTKDKGCNTSIKQNKQEQNRFIFYSKTTGTISATHFYEFGNMNTAFIDAIKAGDFWLDVTLPSEPEMKLLSKIFRIHPFTISAMLTEESREKCELFQHYYFICFTAYECDIGSSSYLEPFNVYNIVFKQGIITFHNKPMNFVNSVSKRINKLKDFITINSDWINYAVIDDVIDSFIPTIRCIELEIETINELVLILNQNEQSDILKRITYVHKRVRLLLKLLTNKPDIIKALLLRCEQRSNCINGSDIKLYLNDIQDHIIIMLQNSLLFEKVLARARSNYLAQIIIELTQISNRTNNIIAKLSAIAYILLPMNIITGLWGMNVNVPGKYDKVTYHWLFGILSFMFVLASLFYILAKRNELL